MRILIVDDNPDALATLGALLTLDGHTVNLAPSARFGLNTAQGSPPDVVVLDLSMPLIDGFELARSLRKSIFPSPLLIAVTGRTAPETADKALAAGIDHIFYKPVLADTLLAVISAHASTRPQ
jgi:DNA-binding response OmpR family regulator